MRERFENNTRINLLEFVIDSSITEGGCLIDTKSGAVDARLKIQLETVEKALLANFKSQ